MARKRKPGTGDKKKPPMGQEEKEGERGRKRYGRHVDELLL